MAAPKKVIKLRGGMVGDIKRLRRSLKRGSGENRFLYRIPEDGGVVVRFLEEPTRWVEFLEHYDDVRKFYPCVDGDCEGCFEGLRPSKRYLANALDVEADQVIPLLLPKTLADRVLKRYDRYNTLLDRDYELTREGTGFETTYDVTPEDQLKRNVVKYDLIDLEDLLKQQLSPGDDTDDDDEGEDPWADDKKPARRKSVARKPQSVQEDTDEEEEEDEEAPVVRRRPVKRKAVAPAPSKTVRRTITRRS